MSNTKGEPVKKKSAKRGKGFSVTYTSLRYLAMLEFIPRYPEKVSVDEIMQSLYRREFEIDKRSIQRDLEKLAKPFQLYSSRDGRSKLWSYSDDAPVRFFPSMDEHTALSFQLIQAFLKPLLSPETLDSIAPLFKKSAELLSHRTEFTARWQEKIHVLPLGLSRQPPTIDPEIQETVYQALLYENPLHIFYRPRNSKSIKEYSISPLGLVIRDYVSYVVAAMHDGSQIRQFALHRFKKAYWEDVDVVKYLRPAGFNLAAYAKEEFGFQMGESKTLDLELWLDKDAAKSVGECPVSKRQKLVEQTDGNFLLSATVPNTLELRRWIHSLGQQAEVLQPGFLRAKFAEEFAAMSKRYKTK